MVPTRLKTKKPNKTRPPKAAQFCWVSAVTPSRRAVADSREAAMRFFSFVSGHQPPALECVTVGDQHSLARGAAVAAVQRVLQPVVHLWERLAEEQPAQEVLRCGDRVRSAEVQNFKGRFLDLERHIKGAVHLRDGIVGIGARLTDDKDGMQIIQSNCLPIGGTAQISCD